METTKLSEKIKLIKKYLNSSENVICRIYRQDYYNDYPQFYQYSTIYHLDDENPKNELSANGISEKKDIALIKTIMETIERFYLVQIPKNQLVKDCYENLLTKSKYKVINPLKFTYFPYRKYTNKNFIFDKKTNFYWTKARSLSDNKIYYLPAQLFFLKKFKEPIIRFSDTQGTAADFSFEKSLLSSIFELIERDAYALFFYEKRISPKINLKKIKNASIKKLIEKIERYQLSIYSFDITSDINIPTIATFVIDKTGMGPALTIGLCCHYNPIEALKKSILEAVQSLNSLRDITNTFSNLKIKNYSYLINKKDINNSILQRLLFWAKKENIDYFKYLFHSNKFSDIIFKKNKKISLLDVKRILTEKKIEIFFKQVAANILNRFSIFIIKSVSYDLLLPSLLKEYPYTNHKRLKKIKVKDVPHPLP